MCKNEKQDKEEEEEGDRNSLTTKKSQLKQRWYLSLLALLLEEQQQSVPVAWLLWQVWALLAPWQLQRLSFTQIKMVSINSKSRMFVTNVYKAAALCRAATAQLGRC